MPENAKLNAREYSENYMKTILRGDNNTKNVDEQFKGIKRELWNLYNLAVHKEDHYSKAVVGATVGGIGATLVATCAETFMNMLSIMVAHSADTEERLAEQHVVNGTSLTPFAKINAANENYNVYAGVLAAGVVLSGLAMYYVGTQNKRNKQESSQSFETFFNIMGPIYALAIKEQEANQQGFPSKDHVHVLLNTKLKDTIETYLTDYAKTYECDLAKELLKRVKGVHGTRDENFIFSILSLVGMGFSYKGMVQGYDSSLADGSGTQTNLYILGKASYDAVYRSKHRVKQKDEDVVKSDVLNDITRLREYLEQYKEGDKKWVGIHNSWIKIGAIVEGEDPTKEVSTEIKRKIENHQIDPEKLVFIPASILSLEMIHQVTKEYDEYNDKPSFWKVLRESGNLVTAWKCSSDSQAYKEYLDAKARREVMQSTGEDISIADLRRRSSVEEGLKQPLLQESDNIASSDSVSVAIPNKSATTEEGLNQPLLQESDDSVSTAIPNNSVTKVVCKNPLFQQEVVAA